MNKVKILILLLICFSCIGISFATSGDASDSTDSTTHITKTTDSVTTQDMVKRSAENNVNNQNSRSIGEEVKNTKTSINHTYVRPKSYVSLNASVRDDNNEFVNEGQVFFKLNNTVLKDINDTPLVVDVENGFAQLNYYVDLIPTGDYNFTAVYNGTTNYNISSADDTLTVHKNKTMMDITINPSPVVSGKKMNLTATFTREDNITVTGGKVAFKLNHITIKDSKGNPIYARLVDGKATIETKIPTGTSAKTYVISATYSGTTINEEARSRDYEFNVTKDDINIKLSQDNYVAERGEKISVSGKILNSEFKDTKRAHKMLLKLNNKSITQQWSFVDTFSLIVDTSDLKDNEYNLTVVVGENGAYNEKREELKLYVTHNYDYLFNATDMLSTNDKHIVLNIDNNSYEIKNALLKNNTEIVFDEAKVLIENNIIKVNYIDNRTHEVSIDHYDDIVDLTNVTLTSDDEYLSLFFDGLWYDLTGIYDREFEGDYTYGHKTDPETGLSTYILSLRMQNKILKFSYKDNQTHNISIYNRFWIESNDIDNPGVLNYTETKLVEFIGSKS